MEEKNAFYALVLVTAGENKVAILSQIRQIKNCDLETGKALVDKPNTRLITTLTHSAKELIDTKLKLEQLGATAKIVKCINKSVHEPCKDNTSTKSMSDEQTKCAFCGGIILKKAKKCKHCGKWINEKLQSQEQTETIIEEIETTNMSKNVTEKSCPFCCRKIPVAAKKCQYCGEWIEQEAKPENAVYKCWNILSGILLVIISVMLELMSNGSGTGITFAIIAFIVLAIYFLPTTIADEKRHPNTTAIFVVNLFFGCTLIGWVIALVWSLIEPDR